MFRHAHAFITSHWRIVGGVLNRIAMDDHNEMTIKAALAIAAIYNSSKEVPGEPRCGEVDTLVAAGWSVDVLVDDDGYTIKLNPCPKEKEAPDETPK